MVQNLWGPMVDPATDSVEQVSQPVMKYNCQAIFYKRKHSSW